jgi:hypothetical protein
VIVLGAEINWYLAKRPAGRGWRRSPPA